MRIDGSHPDAGIPVAGKAERITSGDVVQGRVVSAEAGQIQLRLSDGSTLNAKVAEGVNLEEGANVRLQIGEKVDGVPTARVMERSLPRTVSDRAAMTPEREIGDALRNLGEKVLPALVDRAMALRERTGMDAGQAAFLAANNLDADPLAGAMLARVLNGSFGFASNWTSLASRMADAASALPAADRAMLAQSLALSEQVGKLVDTLLAGAGSSALKVAVPSTGTGVESAASKPTGPANAIGASGAGDVSEETGPADASNAGKALLANTVKDLFMQWAEKTPASGEALRQLQDALAGIPGGKALLAALTGKPEGAGAAVSSTNPAGAASSAVPGNAATAANMADSSQASVNTGLAAGTSQSASVGNAAMGSNLGFPASGVAGTAGTAGVAGTAGTAGDVQPAAGTTRMEEWLGRLAGAVDASKMHAAPTPAETRAMVMNSFDRVILKAGSEGDASPPLLDVAKMAHVVKEQLEWSSNALSRMDADTAAALTPLVQDASGAMRLFNQITTYSTFVQIPIQMNQQNTQGELYVMKRKGGRNRIDASDFTLFLSLDTENLGHLESLAHAKNRQVSLQFRVDDEETQTLLRETRQSLYEGLDKKGFRLVDMKVRTASEEPLSPLNAVKEAEERLGRTAGLDIRL